MVRWRYMKNNSLFKNIGFTLLEVMIALAIMSTSLIAVLFATSQFSESMFHLKDKMAAYWVGQNALAELRVGEKGYFLTNVARQGRQTMLDKDWYYSISINPLNSNPKIFEIMINVSTDPQAPVMAEVVSYAPKME